MCSKGRRDINEVPLKQNLKQNLDDTEEKMVTQSAHYAQSTNFGLNGGIAGVNTVSTAGSSVAASNSNPANSFNTSNTAHAPEKKFSAGGISATIWANEKEVNGAPVSVRTVTLSRTYKGADGQWKQSSTLRINDVPKAQLVLEKAYEYLTLKDNSSSIELM